MPNQYSHPRALTRTQAATLSRLIGKKIQGAPAAKETDLSRFHGTDERLSIQNYAEMIAFYHRLISSASQPPVH